jgi:hypothetical protein
VIGERDNGEAGFGLRIVGSIGTPTSASIDANDPLAKRSTDQLSSPHPS